MFSNKYEKEKQKTMMFDFDILGNPKNKCKNLYIDFYRCFSNYECYNSKKIRELLDEIKKECH